MANKGLIIGKQAPDFQLPATNNQQIRLSDYEGQTVILAFLRGTW